MKRTTLGIAVAVAVGMLSTAASAVTLFGNVSNKGSLLIYPRIDTAAGNDTLITITNDNSGAVRLKCFYATSDPVPTPNSAANTALRGLKHFLDFTIDLTHNQPISWWASSGYAFANSTLKSGQVAPPFGIYPDGATRTGGELKCWASTNDGSTELMWNHLYGTASVLTTAGTQAYEYTAVAFQAEGASTATGTPLGSPGLLNLDNVEYDACPNILLGNFIPTGFASPLGAAANQVTLASCNQDLRQAYTPTITKLTWTFWNQDEQQRTGSHFCADSWFETTFPVATWPEAGYAFLGTGAAYFRIETTADTQICGPSAVTSAYVGNIAQQFGAGYTRGTNLTGRGVAPGLIKYDPQPPDSSKQ
jgi:hypothetical protein